MKRINFYLSMLLLMAFAVSCNDEFDMPPLVVPTAEHTANMTLLEFKEKYWQDPVNYIDTIWDDYVIHGYITSSDESGNIYKSLYIQDETTGLKISINQSNLYTNYRYGQEIVIPLKYIEGGDQNVFVGKYTGIQQLGEPTYYTQGKVWEASFLPYERFQKAAEINGLPDVSKVDTVVVKITDLTQDKETQWKYGGQLVKIENVKFEDADGVNTFASSQTTVNRKIVDEEGNTLIVRNSGYASFFGELLPVGYGDVVGLVDHYQTNESNGTWQLYLRSTSDCMNFQSKGSQKDPYTIEETIEAQGTGVNGWVKGFIVGAVAPEVTTVSSNSDIEFHSPTTLDNTIVIADNADETDFSKCVVVPLPAGTPLREQANMKDNTVAYKTVIYVLGNLENYMGTYGVTGNTGSTDEFKMTVVTGGVTTLDEGFESGSIPDTWKQVQVSGDKAWYVTTFNNNAYAAMTGYKGTKPPFDQWLITPALDIANAAEKILTFRTQVAGYGSTTSKFEVYILDSDNPNDANVKVQLNPKIAVASTTATYSDWVESGSLDLSNYNGTYFIGFRFYATQDANYATWCLDDVKFNAGGGSVTPEPANENRADFESLNNSTATGIYGNYTSANGWAVTNSNVLIGGEADSNPVFQFIGFVTGSQTKYAVAPCINGKVSTPGVIMSPALKGGMKSLKFNYGLPYSKDQISFRVEVYKGTPGVQLPNPYIVKEVKNENATKGTVYTFDEEIAVDGDFFIRIINDCPQQSDSNKDRVAIWNLEWEQ